MGFVEAVQTCFSKYIDFSGRARRSEYWYFVLFLVIASIVIGIIDMVVFGPPSDSLEPAGLMDTPLSNLFSLATFIPSLSATSRRLHDIGKSGWMQLLPIVPAVILGGVMGATGGVGMIGGILALVTLALMILLIVWCATDTHAGENQYGDSPK